MQTSNIREQVPLPVFVIPSSLSFSVQDSSAHKQVLTLYNPCQFDVIYQFFSTAPTKYEITESSGFIKAGFKIDIVVRHSYPNEANIGSKDYLQVEMRMHGNSSVFGKRIIPLNLTKEIPKQEHPRDTDNFQKVPQNRRQQENQPAQQQFGNLRDPSDGWSTSQILLAIVGVIILMLPTEGDRTPTLVPPLFHFSTAFKNVVSFCLGVLTCAYYYGLI